MKKKFLSVILSIILIICAVSPTFIVANAEVWSGGRVVPSILNGVYQLATGENLAWFANAVNSGNNTIKGILTADIELNQTDSTSNKWTPIGTADYPFKGELDGNGFTISGMAVESESQYAGLFGCVYYDAQTVEDEDVSPEYTVGTKNFTINNITLTDASVVGTQNTGGIVGYSYNAGILNCSFDGTINCTENSIGGIVGWADGCTVVSQCQSSGKVTGHLRTGGTAGYVSGNSVVIKCYGDTLVTGYKNVGGIVGTLSAANVIGCYFLGAVSALERAGGLIGYSAFGSVKSAYTISSMTSTGTYKDFGGAVGVTYGGSYAGLFYCYEQSGIEDKQAMGRTTQEMSQSGFVKEVNRFGSYFCSDYTSINNGHPVLAWMLALDVWAGDQVMPKKNTSGTYLISKPSELAWFSGLVNGTLTGFDQNTSANAIVTDDLLFNIDTSDADASLTEWTPIGTASSPYTGTFDGGGYNIAGVYTSENAGTSGTNVGLFGYVGAGTVSNVVMVDGLICGKENVGGIIGYIVGGTVRNCLCDSEVRGDRAVGGIAGYLGSSATTVEKCGMAGVITGTNVGGESSSLINVGGIVGYSNRASVTQCFSSGTINAALARFVGGIAGSSSAGKVTSCYSTSTVSGNAKVGGIVGNNNNGTVSLCYVAGKVKGVVDSGIVLGMTSGANVSGCYYDDSFKSAANTSVSATAKTSAQMTGTSSVYNMSLGSNFVANADDTYFYYYPQISVMANSSVTAIKNASKESVRFLQDIYLVRVEMDGRTDTYYQSIDDALDYVSNTPSIITPTVFLVRDVELDEAITIDSDVSFFGENGATLTRGASLTGAMITITGNASVGSSVYGDDTEPQLYIDGASIPGTSSAIVVDSSAELSIQPGVVIENCKTANTTVRGAAVNVGSGTFSMYGGTFADNEAKSVGGAVYSEEGTVTVSAGNFLRCSASQGGAVYNNNGILNISGGTFDGNIANTNGGAVAGYGVYSETTVSGRANLINNTAVHGGAVAVTYYGTLTVSGGTLQGNMAKSNGRGDDNGGSIYIESGADCILTGGAILENTSESSVGNGIYVGGTLTMSGSAQVDSSNDVYLDSGKTITISDRLTCSGYAATIRPYSYSEGLTVLDGTAMKANYGKFGVVNSDWHVLATGKITSSASTTVAILSVSNAYSVEYTSLADAFAAVGDGDTAVITVVANNTINSTITVRGDVTISCDDTSYTSTRSGAFHGIMFDVQPNAILNIGDATISPYQQAQTDYIAETRTDGQYIIDGGYMNTEVVGAAVINVQSGGQLIIHDDAIIQNNANTTTGTVVVSGTADFFGGTICSNQSCYGGAFYVKNTGVLKLCGGMIYGNTSSNGGNAVYSEGKVVRNVHSYDYYLIETLYDEGGSITGMSDPQYQLSGKTDVKLGENQDVYLKNNVIYVGETNSSVNITSISKLPETTELTYNTVKLSLAAYTSGNTVILGDDVSTYYTGFKTAVPEYTIESTGKLNLVKLLLKSNSAMRIDREKNLLTGIDLSENTVGAILNKFVNTSSQIKFYSAKGVGLRNTAHLTTGCTIKLLDSTGKKTLEIITVTVYGDLNGDELTDGQDAVLVRSVAEGLLNSQNSSVAVLEAADINFDGSVTYADSEHVEAAGLGLQSISQTR